MFSQHLLSVHYVLGTVLDSGDTAVNQWPFALTEHAFMLYEGEVDSEQIEIKYDIKWHKDRVAGVRHPFYFVGSAEVDFPNVNEA